MVFFYTINSSDVGGEFGVMILPLVCIFLTLYLYYRFTEIQHSNLDTQNKVTEFQGQLADLQNRLDELQKRLDQLSGIQNARIDAEDNHTDSSGEKDSSSEE